MLEHREIELKEIVSSSYLKVVSAYANYGTGKIIFGITDSGDEKPLSDISNEKINIENSINGNIKPVPEFSLDVQEGKIILIVQKGEFTPYLYRGKAYKRSDTSSVEVDEVELKRLILDGRNKSFEEIKAQKQELSFKYLENMLISTIGISELNTDILKTLQLYSDRNGYNLAAYLLSDDLEGVGLDIVKFGSSIDIIEKRNSLLSGSVVKQFNDAVSLFKEYYIVEKIEGDKRVFVELIPLVAFREAVANAIVHRQWDVNANIQISMFSDHIEIVSPGGLTPQISKEEYLSGQFSILRNPILADVFFKLGIIEKFGTGIKRIKLAYKDTSIMPQFCIFDNSIQISLPVTMDIRCSEDERAVLKCFNDKDVISNREIVAMTGFGKSKVIRIIHLLEQKNLISSEGKGRSVKYRKNI